MSIVNKLHAIANDASLSSSEKLKELLDCGCQLLGCETGMISQYRGKENCVVAIHSHFSWLSKGDSCPSVINSPEEFTQGTSGTVNPLQSIVENHPLGRGIYAPLRVNGVVFGAVSFLCDSRPFPQFTEIEENYFTLLAVLIEKELSLLPSVAMASREHDISDEKDALLQQVTKLLGVGTWSLDLTTGQLAWSGALKRMLHVHDEKSLKPEDAIRFIRDEAQRKIYLDMFKRMLKTGKDFVYEGEVITDTGETRWLETRAHPLWAGERCVKVIGATLDITEIHSDRALLRQKMELAENVIKERSDFLANMSHQIRTPIQGIQGMLETLENSPLNAQQKTHVTLAVQSTQALLTIVNDIFDYSKSDNGELSYDDTLSNLANVIDEHSTKYKHLAESKNVTFKLSVEALNGVRLKIDPVRFGQIVSHLLENAVKYTDEGEITLYAKTTRYGKGKHRVKVIVTDSGIGISAQQQSKIFLPFTQVSTSSSSNTGGTGLGLALVKKIVDHYGGSIDVSSEEGIGARFTVALTLEDDSNNLQVLSEMKQIPTKTQLHTLTGLKALIVEDNEINQLVIKEQLKEVGLTAEIAENGEMAINKVRQAISEQQPFAIIFMDCYMPIMDGIEATKRIRALGEEGAIVPIIALTANTLSKDKEKCLNSGMNDFISKPVGVSRLRECIYTHLSQQFHSNTNVLKDPA